MTRRGKTPTKPSQPSKLKHVERQHKLNGVTFLYYRRAGKRLPLLGPEGSAAFLASYRAAAATFTSDGSAKAVRTWDQAITEYLASADFKNVSASTKVDYERLLSGFRRHFGQLQITATDDRWVDDLRTAYVDRPGRWNALRSRMVAVENLHRRRHKATARPWEDSRRLPVGKSDANRPWPAEVLLAVMRAATPEFRALLIGYLLTAQRGSDVTTWGPDQYNETFRTLTFQQVKTGEDVTLHVPDSLARALEAMKGRHPERLFVTPRGRAWTVINAEETLLTLRRNLGLDRYTLHGLRATGPTALKMLGFENRALRTLTGHTSDANLETYLRGVKGFHLARPAQIALEEAFSSVLSGAETGGNERRFSGVTGRAAAVGKKQTDNRLRTGPVSADEPKRSTG